ncbi:MAG: T9SS type A sorting domain-containing protein, partial [Bacteroidia bacterium]
FDGQALEVQGYLELEPDEDFCNKLLPVNEIIDASSLKIYPNPSREFVYLFSNKPSCTSIYKVQFVDHLGQVLESKPFDFSTVGFDIRSYSAALYYIRILDKDDNLITSRKIVVY